MVVELDVPAYQLQDVDVARDNYQRVAVDGALALAVPGKPELPKFSALLGIPAQGRVSVRVLQDSAETLPGRYRLLPSAVPASVAGDLQPGATQRVPDRDAYASVDLYPAEVARVVETAWLRDQRLARIEIYPFQYLAATGALRWHRRLRIEVRFEGGSAAADRLAAPAAAGPFEQILRGNLVNYDVARRWRSSAAAPQSGVTS